MNIYEQNKLRNFYNYRVNNNHYEILIKYVKFTFTYI